MQRSGYTILYSADMKGSLPSGHHATAGTTSREYNLSGFMSARSQVQPLQRLVSVAESAPLAPATARPSRPIVELATQTNAALCAVAPTVYRQMSCPAIPRQGVSRSLVVPPGQFSAQQTRSEAGSIHVVQRAFSVATLSDTGARQPVKVKNTPESDDMETSTSTTAGSTCTLTACEGPPSTEREARGPPSSLLPPGIQWLAKNDCLASFCDMATLPFTEKHVISALGCITLLNMCGYEIHDTCVVMAYASAYFARILANPLGSQMEPEEMGNLLTVCMFVAHCYVLDNNCPLHVWRSMVLKKRCSMRALNQAVVHVLRVRNFRLRVSDDNLNRRLSRLLVYAQDDER